LERRAVEAAIWGAPIVSVDAMRQAFFRDAKARYGDVVYWSRPSDWRNQTTTPNASSLYVYFNFNTKDGPVVIDVPGARDAGLFGTMLDAWQTPLVDVGPEGADRGAGARYLVLPPGFAGDVPAGYVPVRSSTYNGYALYRAIPRSSSPADTDAALALIKTLRVYALARDAEPPEQRYVDMAGRLFDGIVRYDDTFFVRLARMLGEEPVQTRDLVAMGQLRALGIEKDGEFRPDAATRVLLNSAAKQARIAFMRAARDLEPWWPGSHWGLPDKLGAQTGFTFQTPDVLDVDKRGLAFFLACAVPAKLGAASVYLLAGCDSAGNALDGARSYRLHIPAGVPAKQFWSVAVYDSSTAGFFRDSPRVGVDSYDESLERNPDGSVDMLFGSRPELAGAANWIYTAPGRSWLAMFRVYGPEAPILDRTWRLPDVTPLAPEK
jgi:hypothetical protein